MSTGSSNTKPFSKLFQIRWAERLGDPKNPYLIRWIIILFGYSIRLHHWLKSDDRRFFHDHSSDLISIVLKGYYFNVTPFDNTKPPSFQISYLKPRLIFSSADKKINVAVLYNGDNRKYNFVEGMFNSWENFKQCWSRSIWFSKAEQQHYLHIPSSDAWTLLLEGRKYNKWGFYVPRKRDEKQNVRKLRPLEYFHRYGIIQNSKTYQ